MTRRTSTSRTLALLVGVSAIGSLAAAIACGSGGDHAASADSGADSSKGNPDAQQGADGNPGDGRTAGPVGTGALAYCQGQYGALARCSVISSACLAALGADGGLEQSCAQEYGAVITQGALQQFVTCGTFALDCSCFTSQCSDAGLAQESAANACLAQWLAGVSPTPAAQKVASDFCAACPDTPQLRACSGFFSFADAGYVDGGPQGGAGGSAFYSVGFGSIVLVLSGSALAQVDMDCTGAALSAFDAGSGADCYTKFQQCVSKVVQGQLAAQVDAGALPAACQADAGGD